MIDLSKVSMEDLRLHGIAKEYGDLQTKLLQQLFDQICRDAESAIGKRFADELTEGEKFALAYYARVPMQGQRFDPWSEKPYEYRMITVPCGFHHDGEKWIVTMRVEDER